MTKSKAVQMGVGKSHGSVQTGNFLAGSCPAEQGQGAVLCSSVYLHETRALQP